MVVKDDIEYSYDYYYERLDERLEKIHAFLDGEIGYLNSRVEQGISAQQDVAIKSLYKMAREKFSDYKFDEALDFYSVLRKKDSMSWEPRFFCDLIGLQYFYKPKGLLICDDDSEDYIKAAMPLIDICDKNTEEYFRLVDAAEKAKTLYDKKEKVQTTIRRMTADRMLEIAEQLEVLYRERPHEIETLFLRMRDYCYRIGDFLNENYPPNYDEDYISWMFLKWEELWRMGVKLDYLLYNDVLPQEFDGSQEASEHRRRMLQYIGKIVERSLNKDGLPHVDTDEEFAGKKLYYDEKHRLPPEDKPQITTDEDFITDLLKKYRSNR